MSSKNTREASLRSKVQQRRVELAGKRPCLKGLSTWVVAILLGLATAYLATASLIGNGSIYAGVSGAGMLLWLVFGITALYVIAVGRPSWLRLRYGRRSAVWPAAYSAGAYLLSGTLMAALSA